MSVSWVDPFDEPSPPVKPGARPGGCASQTRGHDPRASQAQGHDPAASQARGHDGRASQARGHRAAPAKLEVAAAAPPAQSLPSKELEVFMKAFEGRWKCSTNFPAGSPAPARNR